MKNQRISRAAAIVLTTMGLIVSGTASAAGLNDLYRVSERINAQAKKSQAKIDALTDQTRVLYNEYKTVLKEIEGLRVYNRQLEKQIGSQETEMTKIASSIDEVTVIERQITPLMLRMIDGLDQFVALDSPFLKQQREERLANLRTMMDRADVAVSEKFSQVLKAYQIENDYGRTMEAYGDTIDVAGNERIVDVLKVGRVSLVYQTPDGEESGVWNSETNQWEVLDDSYKQPVRNGIRMARKQLSANMLSLPVKGAGAAQ